jgi:hypothetical protein
MTPAIIPRKQAMAVFLMRLMCWSCFSTAVSFFLGISCSSIAVPSVITAPVDSLFYREVPVKLSGISLLSGA